jgi:NAD(P)-dependent dehydrogenase (short-subunit alcohol dehydrogenase family)
MGTATAFYQDKAGLVTGSGSGMGRAMAIAFAAAGAKVLVTDVNVKGGEETVATILKAGGKAKFLHSDASSAAAVQAMVAAVVAEHGRLDFAVNNAAIEVDTGPLADCPDDAFDRLVAVNIKGVFLCMKHEIRQMLKQGGGAIVNIASTNAFRPQLNMSVYTATKHAVVGLTRNAAIEYAAAGIRINAICPGAIDTPMLQAALGRFEGMNIPREQILGQMSLINRPGRPEEVAKAALWLCSDDASFTYGHALAVDGGYLAR